VESYASLLDGFPASQAKVARYVGRDAIIGDKLLADAREQALNGYARMDQNVKRISALQPYRVSGAAR
jgi:hypothetical protein